MSRLCGIFGKPYIDLSELIDTSSFAELDEELMCALPRVERAPFFRYSICVDGVFDNGFVEQVRAAQRRNPRHGGMR